MHVKELEKGLRSPKWSTVQHAPSVRRLGEYLTNQATLLLFEDSPKGWAVFVEGLEYLYWSLRVSQSEFVGVAVSTYVNLMLTGQVERADWLLRRMVADAQEPADGWHFRWVWSPFSQLVTKLGARLGRCDEPQFADEIASEFVSPFMDVLEAWPDAAATAAALKKVCAHHVRFARSSDDHDFQRPLYAQVCPLEVHFVNHCRREAGLDEVAVKHALLDTPFGKPPPAGIDVPDLCKPVADLVQRARDEGLIDEDD
ncbi:MAG: hypothetical protein KC731_22580 [Myxococcales bacterium]|nr:hypothetical protein [Myxococcales bacterium]